MLDYSMNRYYWSTSGRFSSVDPDNAGALVNDPQSWNAYSYVNNSPLTFTDPLGLWKQVDCMSGGGQCWEAEKGDSIGSLAKILNVSSKNLNTFFQNPSVEVGQVYDVSGFGKGNIPTIRDTGPAVVRVYLVSEESLAEYADRQLREDAAMKRRFQTFLNALLVPKCAQQGRCMMGIFFPDGLPTGLRVASPGLQELFSSGSIRNMPILNIRNVLMKNGFTETVTRNGSGYLFRNALGEEVRIMSRNEAWDVRVMNSAGNYLDEFGNVGLPSATHNITVVSK